MKRKKRSKNTTQVNSLTRVTRSIYFALGFYILSIIIFDSGNLITREAVINRWTLATGLLAINTIVWYIASQKGIKQNKQLITTYILTMALLIFAGFTTYWERGMASTSTIFYVLPLLVVATLKNRHALFTTAILSAGSYGFAVVKYFNDFFNEGYRIQLWGYLLLYVGIIFTVTWLIMVITGLRHDSR